jgi:hypothetical protein
MVQCGNRQGRGRGQGRIDERGHRAGPEPVNGRDDVIRVHRRSLAGLHDGVSNHLHRVFGQELQNSNVLPCATGEPVPFFEVGPQLVEAGRQLPFGKHKGMIQGRRPTPQDRQVMLGRHDPFVPRVTTDMTSDDSRTGDHLDPIGVRLDRHRLEGPAAGNTVAIRIESHRLVLVHLGALGNKGIEGPRRQGQSRLSILLEQLPDRLRLTRHRMVPLGQGTRPQVHIQLGQVLHPGNRGRPVPLQIVHAVFHVGLLVASRRHTEAGIETVMARQRGVPRLHLALPALQDRRGYGRRIVPPDLPGHAAEELQPLDHPRQNRLGLLARQHHGEATARVTPRQQQHRDLLPSLREVHIDMPEVRLQPPARRICRLLTLSRSTLWRMSNQCSML